MLKSKGLLILAMLAVLAPNAGHAFPSFNQSKDMFKLLFAAAEDVAVEGDLTKRTTVKLSDGKTYLITFAKGENNADDEDGIFGASLIPTIMKDSDPAKISSQSAFKRLLKFQERLLDHNKKDVAELAELGVLYNSPFVTGKTTEELKAELKKFTDDIKRAKSLGEGLKLALKQLVDLYELKDSSSSEEGFHFVNKVGGHEGKVQKYVLKIRQFAPLAFEITRVKAPTNGGGTGNTNSDAAQAFVNQAGEIIVDTANFGQQIEEAASIPEAAAKAEALAALKARLDQAISFYTQARTAAEAAIAATEPNAETVKTSVNTLGTSLNTLVQAYNQVQADNTLDITFSHTNL